MSKAPRDLSAGEKTGNVFLYKIDPEKGHFCRPHTPPPTAEKGAVKGFPEAPCGEAFCEQTRKRLADMPAFCAMAVEIDCPAAKAGKKKLPAAAAVEVEAAAKALDWACKTNNGFWGRIDTGRLGGFFSGMPETAGLVLGKKIQKKVSQNGLQTVTIGVAVYPGSNYRKDEILENACKALDHAAFFGPASAVIFDAVSLNISADRYYQQRELEGAIREFKQALKLDPSNVNVHNSLGVCFGEQGEMKAALKAFETAARIDPKEAMAWYNQGLANRLMEKHKKAFACFAEAMALNGDLFEAVFETGTLHLELNAPEKACPLLEKAQALRPDSAKAAAALGECYAALEKTDAAIRAYQRAVKYNPDDAEALSALGALLEAKGKELEVALTFCRHSVDLVPDNGLFRQRLGKLYLRLNRFDEAVDAFKAAEKRGVDSGHLLEKAAKKRANTVAEFEKAAKLR